MKLARLVQQNKAAPSNDKPPLRDNAFYGRITSAERRRNVLPWMAGRVIWFSGSLA